jgi:hypothetical protein
VEYWFTDLDESVSLRISYGLFVWISRAAQDGRFSYSYRLEPGVNRESHAIVSALASDRERLLPDLSRLIRRSPGV